MFRSIFSLQILLSALLLAWIILANVERADATTASDGGIVDHLTDMYENLPEHGKFATGAAIGFTTSRMAVRTVVGVVKTAGAAFIASEVLAYSGVLDKIADVDLSDDTEFFLRKVRKSVGGVVSDFRTRVRRRLSPEQLGNMFDASVKKEKMATLGFATGAFVGFMI